MVEQQEQHRATSNSCWLKIENFQFYIKLVLILCYTKKITSTISGDNLHPCLCCKPW